MKRLFTFIFILLIVITSYAQKPVSQKLALADKTTIDTQSFTIDKVYPNPVKDFITVEMNANNPGNIEISLINILGTEVKKWTELSLNQGDQKVKLDLSEFKSGVYILKVSKQDQVKTQVLKKN